MGASCSSAGALLMVAAANGDVLTAQEIIRKHPRASLYHNFKDKSSPLLQAAARGHFELLQMIIEAAVMSEGPEKTRKLCIDHANLKKQTALMVACKHGHPECVEYLVSNGADPLICDERRHNTCLHLGALYGHSECIHKLLAARSSYSAQTDVDGQSVKFVDSHNGWGLTALHIAVFQGAVNTARALLRHGASLESVITPPRVENSPIRCAVGSNALHIAALVGNVAMARVILEAQESVPGLELRTAVDSAGMRPQEYAQRARNLVLVHLLDDRLPVHLLRQVWLNYSLDGGMPARHQTLGSMLQKLKLMFNLEVIAAQRNISVADAMLTLDTRIPVLPDTSRQPGSLSYAGSGVLAKVPIPDDSIPVAVRTGSARSEPGAVNSPRTSNAAAAAAAAAAALAAVSTTDAQSPSLAAATAQQALHMDIGTAGETPRAVSAVLPRPAGAVTEVAVVDSPRVASISAAARALEAAVNHQHVMNMKAAWQLRLREINALLVMVSLLYDSLQRLVGPDAAGAVTADGAPVARSTAHEAILDFILSMLITPRTVSAVLHSAKKLVTATVQATGTAGGAGTGTAASNNSITLGGLQPPSTSSEAQHSMGLLLTALKAVETCLQAAAHLSEGNAAAVAAAAAAGGGGQGAAAAVVAAATAAVVNAAAPSAPRTWMAVDQPTTLSQDPGATSGNAGDTTRATAATTLATVATTVATEVTTNTVTATEMSDAPGIDVATPTSQDGATASPMAADPLQSSPRAALPPLPHGFLLEHPLRPQPATPATDNARAPDVSAPVDPVQLLRTQMAAIAPGASSAATALANSHWSSHLHTLLAQLQWDIGIQRHRRRRQHAAAAAGRAAATTTVTTIADPASSVPGASDGAVALAAAVNVGGGMGSSPLGMPLTVAGAEAAANSGHLGSFSTMPAALGASPAALASRYEILVQRAELLAAAHQDMQAGLANLTGADAQHQGSTAPTTGALGVLYRVLSRRGDGPQDVLTAADAVAAEGPAQQGTVTTAATSAAVASSTPAASAGPVDSALTATEWTGRSQPTGASEVSSAPLTVPVQLQQIRPILGYTSTAAASAAEQRTSLVPLGADTPGSRALPTVPDNAPASLSLRPSQVPCFDELGGSHNSLSVCGLVRSSSKQRLGGKSGGKDGGQHAGGEWHGDDLGDSDSGCESISSDSEAGVCAICMDLPVAVMVTPCSHGVCVQCALQLTVKGRELPSCPFCRRKISGFEHKVILPAVGHRDKSASKASGTASQTPSTAALRTGMLAMDSMTESQR